MGFLGFDAWDQIAAFFGDLVLFGPLGVLVDVFGFFKVKLGSYLFDCVGWMGAIH